MSVFGHDEAGRLEILLHTQTLLVSYRPAGTTLTKPRARHGELASLPLPWEPSCELHQVPMGRPSSQTYRSSRLTPWAATDFAKFHLKRHAVGVSATF